MGYLKEDRRGYYNWCRPSDHPTGNGFLPTYNQCRKLFSGPIFSSGPKFFSGPKFVSGPKLNPIPTPTLNICCFFWSVAQLSPSLYLVLVRLSVFLSHNIMFYVVINIKFITIQHYRCTAVPQSLFSEIIAVFEIIYLFLDNNMIR